MINIQQPHPLCPSSLTCKWNTYTATAVNSHFTSLSSSSTPTHTHTAQPEAEFSNSSSVLRRRYNIINTRKKATVSWSVPGPFMWMSVVSGRKRPFCPSSVALLLILSSVLHVWISCQVGAIRSFPQPPAQNHTQIFRQYLSARIPTNNATFLENKRRIPSCPDPLHN